jgi:hypothetical protein
LLIEFYNKKPLRLYVYNVDDDRCREVVVTPNSAWGGEGSMGCGIGFGYLHRIPKRDPVAPAPSAAGEHGHSHSCSGHGHSHGTPLAAIAAKPATVLPAHGHSHSDGSVCHGHGHRHVSAAAPTVDSDGLTEVQLLSPAPAAVESSAVEAPLFDYPLPPLSVVDEFETMVLVDTDSLPATATATDPHSS